MKNKNEESQKIYERQEKYKKRGTGSIKILLNYYKNSTRNKKAEEPWICKLNNTVYYSVYTTKNYICIYISYIHIFDTYTKGLISSYS